MAAEMQHRSVGNTDDTRLTLKVWNVCLQLSFSLCCCFHSTSSSSCDQIHNYKRVKRSRTTPNFMTALLAFLNGDPGIQWGILSMLNFIYLHGVASWSVVKTGFQSSTGLTEGALESPQRLHVHVWEKNKWTRRQIQALAGLVTAPPACYSPTLL